MYTLPSTRINIARCSPAELLKVLSEVGFIQLELEGTPLTSEDVTTLFRIHKDVFNVPADERDAADASGNGFHGMKERAKENARKNPDWQELWVYGRGRETQELPTVLEQHREFLSAYRDKCHETILLVLDKISAAFELDANFFRSRHSGVDLSATHLIHYPEITSQLEPDDTRAVEHADWGDLTILAQSVGGESGLEMLLGGESTDKGEWVPAPNDEGTVTVFVGLALEAMTDGLLKATIHRVVFPEGSPPYKARRSVAFFGNPEGSTVLHPVRPGGLVIEKQGAKTMKQFFDERLALSGWS